MKFDQKLAAVYSGFNKHNDNKFYLEAEALRRGGFAEAHGGNGVLRHYSVIFSQDFLRTHQYSINNTGISRHRLSS